MGSPPSPLRIPSTLLLVLLGVAAVADIVDRPGENVIAFEQSVTRLPWLVFHQPRPPQLKSAAEKRQADREADQAHREKCFASLAQVVIKEKLGKTSDVLNTWGNKLILLRKVSMHNSLSLNSFFAEHMKKITLVVVFDIDISDFYIWCQKRNRFNAWQSYHSAWFEKSIHQDFDCSKAWNLWYATEKYILPELSESCKSKIQQ